jgi:hypothetical protein
MIADVRQSGIRLGYLQSRLAAVRMLNAAGLIDAAKLVGTFEVEQWLSEAERVVAQAPFPRRDNDLRRWCRSSLNAAEIARKMCLRSVYVSERIAELKLRTPAKRQRRPAAPPQLTGHPRVTLPPLPSLAEAEC